MKDKWTEEETDFLIKNHSSLSFREIGRQLSKCKGTVKSKILRLGLTLRPYKFERWTDEEIALLKLKYENTYKSELLEIFPKRQGWEINNMASKLNIKKNRDFVIMAKVGNLLKDSPESLYWMGFLLADGHFSKTNRLELSIATKDKNHLEKFADFLEYKVSPRKCRGSYCVSVMSNDYVSAIKEKYNLHTNKTYNPPNLTVFENLSDELIISLIIGFIDGDGYICKRPNEKTNLICIACHSSWLETLNYFLFRISKLTNIKIKNGIIDNEGYAKITITNFTNIKYLKTKAIEYNLPVLQRKWDTIDLNYISRLENALITEFKVQNMIKEGLKSKQICSELNIGRATVLKYSKKILT